MCTAVQKITKQFSADTGIDILEEALEQASRAHQKAFVLDRITQDCSESITEAQSECIEDFWCDEVAEVSTGVQISTQLLDLVQDLKLCSSEEFDDEDESNLEQALGLAANQYEKRFASDRLAFKEQDISECSTEDLSECMEDFWCDFSFKDDQLDAEVSTGVQISTQLLDLVQDLKLCSSKECDDVCNEDSLQDMNNMPERFAAEDESELLEQALGLAAQQYEKSFASERLAFKELDSDDSELFHDCVGFSIPEDHFNYMPFALGACQISNELLDMVQDMKGMKMTEADNLDEFFFESTDFKSELELSMLEDMNNLQLELPVSEPELVAKNVVAEPTKPKTMAVNWSVRSSVLIASASVFLYLVDNWAVGIMDLM